MKIIVISDTHSQPLPKILLDEIKRADLLIHVGDFCDVEVYQSLKGLQPMRAVYGNMDGAELRAFLPKQAVFECAGIKIGIAHGEGRPEGLVDYLQDLFKGQAVKVVVFGHSHEPFQEVIGGVLFFNPGSPTDSVRAPFLSYGVLELKDGKVKGKIIKLR